MALLIKTFYRWNVVLFYFYTICLFYYSIRESSWIQTFPRRDRCHKGILQQPQRAQVQPLMQQSSPQNQPKFPLILAAGCPLSSPWRWSFILASFSSNNHNVHLCRDKFCKIHSLAIQPSPWGATGCPVPQLSHPLTLLFSRAAFRSKWAYVNREGYLIWPHVPTPSPRFLVHFAQHFSRSLEMLFMRRCFSDWSLYRMWHLLLDNSMVIWNIYISALLIILQLTEEPNKSHQDQSSNEIHILDIASVQ